MELILASASPRRRALMEMLRVEHFAAVPAGDEERIDSALTPEEMVKALSRQKAGVVAARCGGGDIVVVGADTIVVLDGAILGKPKGAADAKRMLTALSGRSHTVWTGVTVIRDKTVLSRAARTTVYFRPLTEKEINAYIATGEPLDKAGAYGIQDRGALFVERIEGDYFNVVGLPLCLLGQMMKELGIDLI